MIPKSLRHRIKSQGIIRTLRYIFLVFILPQIGIRIKQVYIKRGTKTSIKKIIDSDLNFHVIKCFEQLTHKDIDSLYAFEGDKLLQRIKSDFRKGSYCLIGKDPSNSIIGIAWIEQLESPPTKEHEIYLIRDGFLLPQFRGCNYFVILEKALFIEAVNMAKSKNVEVIGNVAFGNEPAKISIIRAGFRYSKTEIKLFKYWKFELH